MCAAALLVGFAPTARGGELPAPPAGSVCVDDDPADDDPAFVTPESDIARLCARWEPDGRLTVQVDKADGEPVGEGQSFALHLRTAGPATVVAQWTAEGYAYFVDHGEGYSFCPEQLAPLTPGTTRITIPAECLYGQAGVAIGASVDSRDFTPELELGTPGGAPPQGEMVCVDDPLGDAVGPDGQPLAPDQAERAGLRFGCARWAGDGLYLYASLEAEVPGGLDPDQRVVVTLTGRETGTAVITPGPDDGWHVEVRNAVGAVRCAFDAPAETSIGPELVVPAHCVEDRDLMVAWRLETTTAEGAHVDEVPGAPILRGGPAPVPLPMACLLDDLGDVAASADPPIGGEDAVADLVRVCVWHDGAVLVAAAWTAIGGGDPGLRLEVTLDADGDGTPDALATGRTTGGRVETALAGPAVVDGCAPTTTPARVGIVEAVVPRACAPAALAEATTVGITVTYESPPNPDHFVRFSDSAPPFEVARTGIVRLPGEDVVDTGVAWSRATFLDGEPDVVLLARDDDYADALASGPLQGALGGPLLFTATGALDPRTAAELDRLAPEEVVVMGGSAAVGDAVVQDLEARGYRVRRIAGGNRFETAARTAEDLPAAAYLVRGVGDADVATRGFADALATSAVAAQGTRPRRRPAH